MNKQINNEICLCFVRLKKNISQYIRILDFKIHTYQYLYCS